MVFYMVCFSACIMCFSCVYIMCHVDRMGEALEVEEFNAKKKWWSMPPLLLYIPPISLSHSLVSLPPIPSLPQIPTPIPSSPFHSHLPLPFPSSIPSPLPSHLPFPSLSPSHPLSSLHCHDTSLCIISPMLLLKPLIPWLHLHPTIIKVIYWVGYTVHVLYSPAQYMTFIVHLWEGFFGGLCTFMLKVFDEGYLCSWLILCSGPHPNRCVLIIFCYFQYLYPTASS